jgi:lipid-binding SYLF domain-containing protein
MNSLLKFSCVLSALALTASALPAATDQERVDQAASIIQRFRALPENSIPQAVLNEAHGLAILTVVKAGFIWSGKFGEGVVIARNGSGWSGPSFIRTAGAGFGPQIGGQVTEFVLVLNTPDAVKAFSEGTNVQLGGALSVAAGPVGRSAEAGVTTRAAVYSYSISQGLFAGVSLEGTVIEMNHKANARYYAPARPVTARLILNGTIAPPPGASVLIRRLQ